MIKTTHSNKKLFKEVFLGTTENNIKALNLIEVQKNSWEKFLKEDIKEILKEFFPISDYTGKKFILHFEDIFFGEPR